MGFFLYNVGYHNSAATLLQLAVNLEGVDSEVASVMATIYAHQGKFLQAKDILHRAMREIEQVRGRNNQHFAFVLTAYAGVVSDEGFSEEAAKAQQAALSIYITLHGSEHIETLGSRVYLSKYLLASSKYGEALSANNNALDVLRVTVGMHHYRASATYSIRAQIFTELGEYSAAEENFRIALPIAEQCCGDKSPEFVRVASNFASLLRQTKRLEEAKQLLERLLKASLLDRDKGEVYVSLGNTYSDLNNYEQANSCLKKALDI